jgi:predicted esterase
VAFSLSAGCSSPPPGAGPENGGDDGGTGEADLCASQCGAECVDVSSDPRHCGGCGKACGAGQSCKAGSCQGGMTPVDMAQPPVMKTGCWADPPPGAVQAPNPPPYSGGMCPMLMAGKNTLRSSGANRTFLLAVPKDLKPTEVLPVVFLWHWLGGSADSFLRKGDIQNAVDQQRFLAVIPEAKGDLVFKWPYNVADAQPRVDEELRFFDDMLACVSQRFKVNKNCVTSAGVSAGALFTDQLAAYRDRYLASAISLSGGVGGGLIRPFGNPMHKLPFLVLWGGMKDICIVINFETASKELENALVRGGHFFLECVHNCGHAEPPVEPPPGSSRYSFLWQFAFDHPYWLRAGESPYKMSGLPKSAPGWCGIGRGSAKQRTGPCPDPGC